MGSSRSGTFAEADETPEVEGRFHPGSTWGWRLPEGEIPNFECVSYVWILLIAAIVVLVIGRRFAGEPLRAKSLIIPLALTVWGLSQLRGQHLDAADLALLIVEGVVGLGLGALRGLTIRIYQRDGHLWMRYRWATLGVWVASIAVRFGFVFGAHLVGVHLSGNVASLVPLGASLLAESAVVAQRATRTGIPFAPDRRRRLTDLR
jgi:hypothetical protein